MRIISGERRGLKLQAPPGLHTRPTLDRVREALFSIIQAHLPQARVLDAYAGAGTLALEALSRGAQHATLIENHPQALQALRQNIRHAKYEPQTTVIARDIWTPQALSALAQHGPYDIIFADPPYDHARDTQLIARLAPLLRSPQSILVLQGAKGLLQTIQADIPNLQNPHLTLTDQRTYGKTELLFLQTHDQTEPKPLCAL